MSFKLFKFPLVPLRAIFSQLKKSEVFDVSTLSKNAKKVVKSIGMKSDLCKITIADFICEIKVYFKPDKFHLIIIADPEDGKKWKTYWRQINNNKALMYSDNGILRTRFQPQNFSQQLEKFSFLLDYVSEIFSVQYFGLISVYLEGEMLSALVKMFQAKQFEKIIIINDNGIPGTMNCEDYDTLLSNTISSGHLRLECFVEDNYTPSSALNFGIMKFFGCKWFTLQNLMTMDCVKVDLRELVIPVSHMMKFLNAWNAGKCSTNLKSILINFADRESLGKLLGRLKKQQKLRKYMNRKHRTQKKGRKCLEVKDRQTCIIVEK